MSNNNNNNNNNKSALVVRQYIKCLIVQYNQLKTYNKTIKSKTRD